MYKVENLRGSRVVLRRKVSDRETVVNKVREEDIRPRRIIKRREEPVAPVETAPALSAPVVEIPAPVAESAKSKKSVLYPGGQNAPRLDLDADDLNDKEMVVAETLNRSAVDRELTIPEIAAIVFPNLPAAQARSWVRNSLRRLVRAGYIERCQRGRYRVADTGRRRLTKVA